MIHKTLICLGLGLALPLATQAETKTDPQVALDALAKGVSSAEQAILDTRARDAINNLAASLADAELSITLAQASDAIRFGQAQGAINALASSLAEAEISIVLADANETIYAASDEQILVELDYLLDSQPSAEANALIMAVVSERPLLATAVQDIAVQSGMDEAMVAASVMSGLGDAPATASGQ